MKRATMVILAFLAAGCSKPASVKARHDTPFPQPIALLPFANSTNSLDGPVLLRALVGKRLSESDYRVTDQAETDRKLRDLGISDGGQLRAVDPVKLGASLGASGLLYGEVIQFGYTNLGVYNKRAVEIRLSLVDGATGARLWESTRKASSTRLGLDRDAITENLAVGLAEKVVEKILKSPLRAEAEEASRDVVRDLNRARNSW